MRCSSNKYWIDESTEPSSSLRCCWSRSYLLEGLIDTGVIGGAAYGSAYATRGFGARRPARIQSGNIRSYAGWLALGAAAVLIA